MTFSLSTVFFAIILFLTYNKQLFHDFFSGDVVTMECIEKIIKKDWINPLDSTKLTESDILPLQRVIIKNKSKSH